MKQNKRIPRISTRGFYDLSSGRTLKKKPYDLYPKKFFEDLGNYPEFTIMVHGMRNNKSGALAKFRIAKNRLKQLGYKYPVVGFSYDSNVRNIQHLSHVLEATKIGKIIAKKNGANLAQFILDFKRKNPNTKIRLVGHSLGTEVISYTLAKLEHKISIIESVYFFGSSVPVRFICSQKFGKILANTVKQKICNYFSPCDEVLKQAYEKKIIEKPLGCTALKLKLHSKYQQKQVSPKNHRFASYALTLTAFP